jgi:hypothetical protein
MHISQKGFSVVEGLLIFVIVVVVGGVGVFVWQAKARTNHTLQTANQGAGDAVKLSPAVNNYADCVKAKGSKLQETYPEVCVTSGGQRFTNSEQAQAEQKLDYSDGHYLQIKEWGIKIALSTNIEDAYYDSYQDDETSQNFSLRAHSLDSNPDCKTGHLSVAAIIKINKDEINSLNGKKYSDSMKGLTIGQDFYYIGLAQYSCAKYPEGQPLLEKIRSAFQDASAHIEKI